MRTLMFIIIFTFASLSIRGQNLIVDGKIGIKTNPSFELDIRTNSLDDGSELNIGNLDNDHFLRLFSGRQNFNTNPVIHWKNSDDLVFGYLSGSSIVEHMRITGNGNIGLGTSTPFQKLHILGNRVRIESPFIPGKFIDFRTDGNALDIASTGGNLFLGANNKDIIIQQPGGNVAIGDDTTPDVRLDVVGSIHYTGSITDVSDIRLKENIVTLVNSIEKINQLSGFVYNLIGEAERNVGVSAQDVQTVLPEAVSEIDDGYLGVDYTQLVPLLIEGMKEQQLEIITLKNEISEIRKLLNSQIGLRPSGK